MSDCIDEMIYDLKNGKEKGSSTYIERINWAWKWRKTEFNLWTGYNNEGKSLFIKYLSLIKALEEDWRFLVSSPEDAPAKEYFDDLIHTASGKSTDRDNPNYISEELYHRVYNKIKNNFVFVYLPPPGNTIEALLSEFSKCIELYNIDVAVIDPLVKFARPSGMERDDLYASNITSMCVDFARVHHISLNLVLHQLTPGRTESGLYPKPSVYSIKGGGSWGDSSDNVLSVWRPYYGKDKSATDVTFSSQKIKKQKLVGIPQDVQIRFDRKTNRYVDLDGKDLYNFDKHFR